MAMAVQTRFRVGDRVRLKERERDGAVWMVLGDDTNRTPVHDPEPAYWLQRPDGRFTRYAYESDLVEAD